MHEFGITSRIVQAVLRAAHTNRANRVMRVDLLIGQLTFLNPAQVKLAYGILAKGTLLEGSELLISQSVGLVECQDCHFLKEVEMSSSLGITDFSSSIPLLACPHCGGKGTVIRGKECQIVGMSVC
jgi:hydrogenase nickel incorporation protein HypA/HybF